MQVIKRIAISFLISIMIVSIWELLLLLIWYCGWIFKDWEFSWIEALLIYNYSTFIFSIVLFLGGEILWNQRWVDIRKFYKGIWLKVVLIITLILCCMASFLNNNILNEIILPNITLAVCLTLSFIIYLNMRARL